MDTLLIVLAALIAQPAKNADDDPEPPRPGPVQVKLVLKKKTFALDRRGLSAEDFEKSAKTGTLTPIRLDAALEITNTSKTSMRVRVSGSGTPAVSLTLTGPGVVESNQVSLVPPKAGKAANSIVVVAPGQTATIPVETLTTHVTTPRNGKHLFFTKPGTYKLEASVRTAIWLDYKGGLGKGGSGKLTYLTPKARAVELTVEK